MQYQLLWGFNEPGEFRYELHLEDQDGRMNQFPSQYVFNVMENLPPSLKFKAPAGDTEVTAIEEMRLQGEARDDYGLEAVGVGYQLAGETPKNISLESFIDTLLKFLFLKVKKHHFMFSKILKLIRNILRLVLLILKSYLRISRYVYTWI